MKTSSLLFVFMTGHFFCCAQTVVLPRAGSLILTEVFPNPTPSNGLPEKEFVEIYNTSTDTLQLSGCSISDGNKTCTFPNFLFKPQTYLLLCKSSDMPVFNVYGPTLGLSSFVSLNNEGDELVIKSSSGEIITGMAYTSAGYTAGRSLENKYLKTFCTTITDWAASTDASGGTPGTVNSVVSTDYDSLKYTLPEISLISDSTVELLFSLSLQPLPFQNGTFYFDEGNIPCSTQSYLPDPKKLILRINAPLLKGRIYTLEAIGIRSCTIDTLPIIKMELTVPEKPDSLDIIINEILFNPAPGYSDFIELYNTSEKYIDLNGFRLANLQNGLVSNSRAITGKKLLFAPHAYLAFTFDKTQLAQKYPKALVENIVETNLPAYNDAAGTAIVLLPNGTISDSFSYSADFHMPLLVDKEGISLERISFYAPSGSKDNWHSAAAGAGFATPGAENSQILNPVNSDGWTVEPLSFSPDGDGYKDFAAIHYALPSSRIATLQVFDMQGRFIKKLVNNTTLASHGFIQWDGLREDETLASAGYYIIHIKSFDLAGSVQEIKKPVVITFKE